MTLYIFRRLLIAVPVLLLITIGTFLLINLAPGDPLLAYANIEDLDAETMEMARARYGLDDPLPVQYVRWLGSVMQGNLGRSLVTQRFISDEISPRFANTIRLTGVSLVLTSVVGISIGVVSALYQYSLIDYTFTVLSLVGLSVPSFFLGLVLVYIFALQLNWFPTSGSQTLTLSANATDFERFIDSVQYYVLPVITLSAGGAASLARFARSGMLEVLGQPYVRFAHAKGLRSRTVVQRHALRNAILQLVTIIALRLPSIFGGSVFVEVIFNWPGIGSLSVKAANDKDYTLILALTLIYGVLVLLANIIADVLYAVLDPRIRYD